MSTVRQGPGFMHLRADARALGLVGLFVIVIGGALLLRPMLVAEGTQPAFEGTSTSAQAAGGVGWAVLEAVFAAFLLLTILAWRRLPRWLRAAIKEAGTVAVWMFVGAWALANNEFMLWFVGGITLVLVGKIAVELDMWWAVNNLLALTVAIYIGAAAGIVLGPVILGVGLIGLAVYDHVFADRSTLMFTLAEWTMQARLPMLIIVPERWRIDWEEIVESLGADEDDEVLDGWGIGMADLALPAAFAVALAQSGGGLPLIGAVAGVLVACGRLSLKMESQSGAGLPALASGAVGGWAIGAALVVVL